MARYLIDPRLSRFTVRAFANGMLAALGHSPTLAIRDFSGDAELSSGTLDGSRLSFRINAASLEVTDDIKDKDRRDLETTMKNEVLESGKYPEIVFTSRNVSGSETGKDQYQVIVNGDLSLRGATRSESIPARIAISGATLRAFGEFSLRQTDYHIQLVSVAGGALKVKDELKFSFDIVAQRQAED